MYVGLKKNKNILILWVILIIIVGLIFSNLSLVTADEDIEIINIELEDIDKKNIKIKWETNVATKGKVIFGVSSQNLNSFIEDNKSASVKHEIILGNLQSDTTYYYQISVYNDYESVNSFINKFDTDDFNDGVYPQITSVNIVYVSGTAAVINISSDESTKAKISYDEFNTYKKSATSNKWLKDHQFIVKSLKPDTKYYLRIYCEDKDENRSSFFYKEFRTSVSNEIDLEDLKITNLRPSGAEDFYITSNSMTVSFKTNHYAKGKVTIKKSGFKTRTQELGYNVDHRVTFYDLSPDNAYTIQISMVDIFNKKKNYEFVVKTKKQDYIAQQLSSSDLVSVVDGSVTTDLGSCSSDNLNIEGYYGKYFNLPTDAPNIKEKKVGTTPKNLGWYDNKYLSFSRIDQNINFGKSFFPIEKSLPGDPNYFSVYWRALIEVQESGDYNYSITSDDDSWVFIDGKLTTDLGGFNNSKTKKNEVNLTKGFHLLEIYFAERKPKNSTFSFNFVENITMHPWPENCTSIPSYPFMGGSNYNAGGVVVAGEEFSYYTPASFLYRVKETPDVYSIINNQYHLISSPSSFREYGYRWENVQVVKSDVLFKYPPARLIKNPEGNTIYYLYQRPNNKWLKINIPSPTVFISYPSNYWGNVVKVNQLDINSYPDVQFIREIGSVKIYYLKDGIKYYISQEEFTKRGFNKHEIVEVNKIHFDSYQTGAQFIEKF